MAPSLTKNNALDTSIDLVDPKVNSPLSLTLKDSTFLANGSPILTHVPSNITATSSPNKPTVGCFVGFNSNIPQSRHVASLGKLNGVKFMSIFRFKVWWTTLWVGSTGNDVQHETQLLLLDQDVTLHRPYVILLPLVEPPFRASLQPGLAERHVDFLIESGSTRVTSSAFHNVLYMHVGNDPYKLVKDAMQAVRAHLGSFNLTEAKSPPPIVDKFGWCTWDAFYLDVNPNGVREGVKALAEGGSPPGMVLIDDGWQSVRHDDVADEEAEGAMQMRAAAGEQMPCRLISTMGNEKFRNYRSPKREGLYGMGGFVRDLKEEFGSVEHVYVWHALCGYWGGVRPGLKSAAGLPGSKVVRPKVAEGLEKTMEDLAVDKIVRSGVGLVDPEMAYMLYEGIHRRLKDVGIDGVKVDVIHILEMLAEEYGGRVELAKAYYKALTASVRKHFNGNGVIASMEHCNDFMFLGTEAISVGRVGDDFWCTDPSGDPNGTYWLQGCHMVHCAYNSYWMGNFIHPDWDMFQSTHPCAAFHAASRAISGGPLYVSDSVDRHDFKLLKRLVLPDGSILRCQHYALPCRDCLFEDPLHDGETMLKIWNLNKYTGVLGLFNCQGGGWCPKSRRNKSFPEFSKLVTCLATPKNVEWSNGKYPIPIKAIEIFAVYMFQEKRLKLLKLEETLQVSLEPFNYELLTIAPVRVLPKKLIQFAPIGLVNMLNTGGAIQSVEYYEDGEGLVKIGVRGSGEMRVFASERPSNCKVGGEEVEFDYVDRMVILQVGWTTSSTTTVIEYLF